MLEEGMNQRCAHGSDLVAYIYGECTEEQTSQFESHLKTCIECADEIAYFASMRGAFEQLRKEAEVGRRRISLDRVENRSRLGVFPLHTSLTTWVQRKIVPFAVAASLVAVVTFIGIRRGENPIIEEIASNSPGPAATLMPASAPSERANIPVALGGKEVTEHKEPSISTRPENARIASDSDSGKKGSKSYRVKEEVKPTLSNYTEEEDKSLRLADLFDDIGE